MYRSFEARAFRGLPEARLEGLARINLLSGRNDMGKTAMLEALFLHSSGPFAGQNAFNVLQPFRSQPQHFAYSGRKIDNPWSSLFSDFDTTRPISLQATMADGSVHGVRLSMEEHDNGRSAPLFEAPDAVGSVQLSIDVDEGTPKRRHFVQSLIAQTLQGPQFGLSPPVSFAWQLTPPDGVTLLDSKLVKASLGSADLIGLYSDLRLEGSSDMLIEALRGIDDRIRSLEILTRAGQPALHAELDDGLVVPLSLLGDGPSALALYILSIVQLRNGGVLLIDEVETGLHWSTLEHVWTCLHSAALNFDVQIFATTHSRECLEAAASAFDAALDDLRLYRIGPRDGQGRPYVGSYDHESVRESLDMNLDLR